MAAQPTLMTRGTTALGTRGPGFLRAGEWAGAAAVYLVVSPLAAWSTRAVRRTLRRRLEVAGSQERAGVLTLRGG